MISIKSNDFIIKDIDTVLFDKDGTFIDLHFFWGKMTELRVESVIENYKLSRELFSDLCLFLGYDIYFGKMVEDGITAMYSRSIIIEKFCEKLTSLNVKTSSFEIEKIFDDVSFKFYKNISDYTLPIHSAIDFIKKIKEKGIKTGIVTSDSLESTNLTLKKFQWESLFDVVIGRESSSSTKESGIPTKLALEKLNSIPDFTLMIGDAPMDYISSKNAGINNCILVGTGQISGENLKKTTSFVVNSLDELEIV